MNFGPKEFDAENVPQGIVPYVTETTPRGERTMDCLLYTSDAADE